MYYHPITILLSSVFITVKMSENNCEDLAPPKTITEVVDILVNMFGEVMDRDAITSIVESYDGDCKLQCALLISGLCASI